MNFYLDTEFNEFGGELISMALVASDGREWYEVLDCANPGPWVAEHVIPILGKRAISYEEFQDGLSQFLRQFNAVNIIADWPEDVAFFCKALIVGPGMRLDTPSLSFEVRRGNAQSDVPHNALFDARGLKRFYENG